MHLSAGATQHRQLHGHGAARRVEYMPDCGCEGEGVDDGGLVLAEEDDAHTPDVERPSVDRPRRRGAGGCRPCGALLPIRETGGALSGLLRGKGKESQVYPPGGRLL